jgi:hypothetical protein
MFYVNTSTTVWPDHTNGTHFNHREIHALQSLASDNTPLTVEGFRVKGIYLHVYKLARNK